MNYHSKSLEIETMPRYHITPKGNPGVCTALVACPYGDLEIDHYSSRIDASAAYEHKMAQEEFASYDEITLRERQAKVQKEYNEKRQRLNHEANND